MGLANARDSSTHRGSNEGFPLGGRPLRVMLDPSCGASRAILMAVAMSRPWVRLTSRATALVLAAVGRNRMVATERRPFPGLPSRSEGNLGAGVGGVAGTIAAPAGMARPA
jgi:hypothetical protein